MGHTRGLLADETAVFKVFVFLWTEIQMKRQERKRRSTANPAYSGLFEPEVREPKNAAIAFNLD